MVTAVGASMPSFDLIVQKDKPQDTVSVTSYYTLGANFIANKKYEKAYENFNTGLQKATTSKNPYLIALGNYHLGNYHYAIKDIPNAIVALNSALEGFDNRLEKEDIAKCYYTFGSIYKSVSDFEKALSSTFKALQISEEIASEIQIIRSSTLNMLKD